MVVYLSYSFIPLQKVSERCRSLSWKPATAHWKYRNGTERAEQIFLAHAQQNFPLLSLRTFTLKTTGAKTENDDPEYSSPASYNSARPFNSILGWSRIQTESYGKTSFCFVSMMVCKKFSFLLKCNLSSMHCRWKNSFKELKVSKLLWHCIIVQM